MILRNFQIKTVYITIKKKLSDRKSNYAEEDLTLNKPLIYSTSCFTALFGQLFHWSNFCQVKNNE